jgi:hypothetical protein
MKPFKSLSLFTALFTVLAVAPLWANPQRLGDEELAALQMQGATAQDHLKLAAHFLAEADAYEQEAESHEAMAKRYNLPAKVASVKSGMTQHCVHLSRSLKEAAKEAAQLAQSHQAMADQVSESTPPVAAALPITPQRLGAKELASLQMKGATSEDHLKMAAHFHAEAEAFEQQADLHEAMAKRYHRPNLPPKTASVNSGMSQHCLNLSRALKNAAKDATQLSENHKAMAEQAGK